MASRIQFSILVISLVCKMAMAQTTPRNNLSIDTTKTPKLDFQKYANKNDDETTFINKATNKVRPDKRSEVIRSSTLIQNTTLSLDPNANDIFHGGSLVLGAGIIYQKDLLPIMLVAEYGIGRNIGVEIRGWYGSKTKDGTRIRDGLLGVGLNYHFTGDIANSSSRFDAYVGGLYGKILDRTGSAFYAQAGARYYFIERLGAFGNFNIGLIGMSGTNLSFGLTYSLF